MLTVIMKYMILRINNGIKTYPEIIKIYRFYYLRENLH